MSREDVTKGTGLEPLDRRLCNAGSRAIPPQTDCYLDVVSLPNPTAHSDFVNLAEPLGTIARRIDLFTLTPHPLSAKFREVGLSECGPETVSVNFQIPITPFHRTWPRWRLRAPGYG